jgi:hypothetical protein
VYRPSEIEVIPPLTRKMEYLFRRLSDGQLLYVSRNIKKPLLEESFRLFIGNGKVMRQVEFTRPAERYRNGPPGTTIIRTVEGVLFVSRNGQTASWSEGEKVEKLEVLDLLQFPISETEQRVQISS